MFNNRTEVSFLSLLTRRSSIRQRVAQRDMQCSSPVQRSATGTCQGEAGQLASLSHAEGWAPCHGWFRWDLFDIMSQVDYLFGFPLLSNLIRSQASFLQGLHVGLKNLTLAH